ncbi:Serpin-Z3 [Capsicum chinense]|nr:Serpin-Z3 [Capsicum chinense]
MVSKCCVFLINKVREDKRFLSMYMFLPNDRDGLPALLEKISSEPGFLDQHNPLRKVNVRGFLIPKFKISFGIEASKVLKGLGLTLPFVGGLTEMIFWARNIFWEESYLNSEEVSLEEEEYNAYLAEYAYLDEYAGKRKEIPDKSVWPFLVGLLCGLALLVFNLTEMPRHLTRGMSLGFKIDKGHSGPLDSGMLITARAPIWVVTKLIDKGHSGPLDSGMLITARAPIWVVTKLVLRHSLGVQILSRVYRQGCLRVQLVILLCFRRPSHLDRQRAFRAFGFGNARHGSSSTTRYLQYFENMVNFHDKTTPYPQLKIANDERSSPANIITLKVHPPVIGAFLLDRGSPDMSFHLDEWSTKEEINVLGFNKVINTTAFVLHSSTHDKEFVTTYPKGSNKSLAIWNYPQSSFDGASRKVYVHYWVNFWFKGPKQYKEPPPWGYKKQAKPKPNHSPNGYIDMSFLT